MLFEIFIEFVCFLQFRKKSNDKFPVLFNESSKEKVVQPIDGMLQYIKEKYPKIAKQMQTEGPLYIQYMTWHQQKFVSRYELLTQMMLASDTDDEERMQEI